MPDYLTHRQLEQFDRDGFLVIPEFFSPELCSTLRSEVDLLIERDLDLATHPGTRFTTDSPDSNGTQTSDAYFTLSGDKVRFFFEDAAFGTDGKLAVPKCRAVNKIGHALHWRNEQFKSASGRREIGRLARDLGFVDPVMVQSMAILKPAGIGGKVDVHQDAEFLWTDPSPHLVGFWIPLERTTTENGCLWMAPGSHKTHPISRRLVRDTPTSLKSSMVKTGVTPGPPIPADAWIPVPMEAGDLVLIHGTVVHKSEANTSGKSRYAYTFHVAEDGTRGKWSDVNWLQPTAESPFTRVYEFCR